MPDDNSEPRDEDQVAEAPVGAPVSDDVAAAVIDRFADCAFRDSHGQAVVYVPREHWRDVARYLRDEQDFAMLLDVTAVDHLVDFVRAPLPDGVEGQRFEVVANFISHARARRIRTICQISPADPELDSLCDVYPSADLAERETYDLFGIVFAGHPELTRILMPDDWAGHPLRKDDAPARVPVTFKGDPVPR